MIAVALVVLVVTLSLSLKPKLAEIPVNPFNAVPNVVGVSVILSVLQPAPWFF